MNRNRSQEVELAALFAGLVAEPPAGRVRDISCDSREVVAGGLFIACAGGSRHGLEFLPEALAAGATAVAWEPADGVGVPELPAGIAALRVPALHEHLGELANRFFGHPSQQLAVTGITGTNGKTTTAWLAMTALGRLGIRAAYMGTLGWGFDDALAPSALTTPDCLTMHRRLRHLADAGATHVIAEVSSHALGQGRVRGVAFMAAAFSNLSRDHLDYHADLAEYGATKARLFSDHGVPTAIINVGDRFGASLAGKLPPGTRLISVALSSEAAPAATLSGSLQPLTAAGLQLDLCYGDSRAQLHSPLWGRFNAENLLLATGILLACGQTLEQAAGALAACAAPPGRMQLLPASKNQPQVLVDFAHSPAALELALRSAREHAAAGRLWCVFGCGGDRDRGKRAEMGAVAAALADCVVITDDNPRNESSAQIIGDILNGTGAAAAVDVIPDRVAAITTAIRSAAPGDVVLIAGKGHEATQLVRGTAHPFSDVAVASAVLGRPA